MSGGGAKDAQRDAEKAEEERQADVASMVGQINGIFDDEDRGAVYDTAAQSVFDLDSDSIQDNYEDSKRGLDFSLARSGLFGGSNDVNRNAELNDATADTLQNAQLRSDNLKAQWEGEDESLRSSLTAQAASDPSGISIEGTKNQLLAANDARTSTGIDSSISNLFDNFNNSYNINRYNQALTTGYNQGSSNPTPSAASKTYQGG